MDVDIEAYDSAGVQVVRLPGEIDSHTAPQLQLKIEPLVNNRQRVLLDMQRVHYLSSAGLRLLLILYRQITGRGGRVVITGLSDVITDIMSNTGFMDFFETYDSLEAGLQALITD